MPYQIEVLNDYEITISRGLHASLYRLPSSHTSIINV